MEGRRTIFKKDGRTRGASKSVYVMIVSLILVVFFAVGLIGYAFAKQKSSQAEPTNLTGFSDLAGMQFETVKKIRVNLTHYSPCVGSNNCDCKMRNGQPIGGGEATSDGRGSFQEKDGRLRWVKKDGSGSEDFVFAEPQSDAEHIIIAKGENFSGWEQFAIVLPGFKNNLPIKVRDHYASDTHVNQNYLDLFVPCNEWAAVEKELQALPNASGGQYDALIVDTTKPISSSVVATGALVGATDFREIGPNSGDSQWGKWKNIDEVFSYLGGKSPAVSSRQLSTVSFLGKRMQVNRTIISVLKEAEDEIKKSGSTYKITEPGSGGYNWRTNVNSPGKVSPHATGFAFDMNPKSNDNVDRSPSCKPRDPSCCPHNIPKVVSDALEKRGFFWGAKFKGKCDSMHFQYGGNW